MIYGGKLLTSEVLMSEFSFGFHRTLVVVKENKEGKRREGKGREGKGRREGKSCVKKGKKRRGWK